MWIVRLFVSRLANWLLRSHFYDRYCMFCLFFFLLLLLLCAGYHCFLFLSFVSVLILGSMWLAKSLNWIRRKKNRYEDWHGSFGIVSYFSAASTSAVDLRAIIVFLFLIKHGKKDIVNCIRLKKDDQRSRTQERKRRRRRKRSTTKHKEQKRVHSWHIIL